MKNQFEQLLETELVDSFRLSDELANDLSRESTDNITPVIWLAIEIAIITSASSC
jgi:hypothetical protein